MIKRFDIDGQMGGWCARAAQGSGEFEQVRSKKFISKVARVVAPVASLIPGWGPVVSAAAGFIGTALSKEKGKASADLDPAILAQQKRTEAALAQQKALADRERVAADEREAELDKQLAAGRRVVSAKRRGRGGLAFSGPDTGLKTQLGG